MFLPDYPKLLTQRLPNRVRAIPFLPEHAILVGTQSGLNPRQQRFIYGFQAAAGPAVSLIFGERLAMCFGVFPVSEHRVELWMVLSDHGREHFPIVVVKVGHAAVYCLQQYPRLTFAQVSITKGDDRAFAYANRIGFRDVAEVDENMIVLERKLR